MEAIIKSPLISDEIVLWTGKEKPVPKMMDTVTTPFQVENAYIPEIETGTTGTNQISPPIPEVLSAGETHLEAEPKDSPELTEVKLRELEQRATSVGYEQGFAQGEAEAKAKYAESLSLLRTALEDARNLELQIMKRAEGIIGAIAFEAVSKIIGAQLCTKEGRKEAITRAISNAKSNDLIKIRVSPQDFENLKNDLDEELANLPWEMDSSVELGGCIIGFVEGSVDARIETQFRLFAQSIKEAAGNGE